VTDEAAPHDLTAKLVVTAARQRSMSRVVVNGRQRATLQVHVALTIAGTTGIVDEVANDFESAGGPVSDDSVAPLVARLNGSPGLSRYAADLASARQAKTAAAQAAVEQAAQAKAAEDEAAWQAADPSTCAAAAAATACAPLDAFLKARPNSPHAQQAQQTLDAARPAITALADTAAWADANPAACKAPRKLTDCDGITAYMRDFPNGAHASEARATRDVSARAIDMLGKQEQARLDAETRRAVAKQMKDCTDDCTNREGYCRQGGAMTYSIKDFQECSAMCIRRCQREVGN
jgi:hypothetical protein